MTHDRLLHFLHNISDAVFHIIILQNSLITIQLYDVTTTLFDLANCLVTGRWIFKLSWKNCFTKRSNFFSYCLLLLHECIYFVFRSWYPSKILNITEWSKVFSYIHNFYIFIYSHDVRNLRKKFVKNTSLVIFPEQGVVYFLIVFLFFFNVVWNIGSKSLFTDRIFERRHSLNMAVDQNVKNVLVKNKNINKRNKWWQSENN